MGILHISARLPRSASLELSARLLAARPQWDVEVEETGLSFALKPEPGTIDSELAVLEEACRQVERGRSELAIELHTTLTPNPPPPKPSPTSVGPWRLAQAGHDPDLEPTANQLLLPPGLSLSRRWWQGQELLLASIAEYFLPPPGAPETRGLPCLILESGPPLPALAALAAGSGPVTIITHPNHHDDIWPQLAAANGRSANEVAVQNLPLTTLAKQKSGWIGHFGLIAVHLSPYLCSRRLKILARWLAPGGLVIVVGFAPGLQTAHLLRAAARVGLNLAYSATAGDWAALKLKARPVWPELPPLTGSLVPELMDLPPVAAAILAAEIIDDELESTDEPQEMNDQGLILEDDEDDEE